MLTFWPHTLRLLRPLGTYWRSVLTAHTDTIGLSAARSALFSSLPPCESIIVTGAEIIQSRFLVSFFAGNQFFRDFRRPSCQETNPVIISQMSSQLSNRQSNIALTAAAAECLFGKIQDAIKSGRAQGASSNIAKLDRMGW